MKASVQFPPYKSNMVSYDTWRRSSSVSPVPAPTVSRNNPENVKKNGIRTMVEHFNGEKAHAGEYTRDVYIKEANIGLFP